MDFEEKRKKLMNKINNHRGYMSVLADWDKELTDCTCYNCKSQFDCDCAWDLYNYNGDCLAMK